MPYVSGATVHGVVHVADVYHSPTVFANFVPIALWLDPQGPEAAVANALASISFQADNSITSLDGTDNQTAVAIEQQTLVKNGVISQEELNETKSLVETDTSTPTILEGDNTGSVTLASSIDETLLYDSPLTGIKYYVKTVTKQPGVIFPYDVATGAALNGTTVQEVCDNLRLLIINCYDPIKNQYPDAFMTNSFRFKTSKTTSQHCFGMACDIQYSKASDADYFTRAQWIKDNISYDQFILEYKTTGSKKPWHHISYNKSVNRSQLLTFLNNKNYKGPGVQGLYSLA